MALLVPTCVSCLLTPSPQDRSQVPSCCSGKSAPNVLEALAPHPVKIISLLSVPLESPNLTNLEKNQTEKPRTEKPKRTGEQEASPCLRPRWRWLLSAGQTGWPEGHTHFNFHCYWMAEVQRINPLGNVLWGIVTSFLQSVPPASL